MIRRPRRRPRIGLSIALSVVMIFVLFPVYWMITTSVKVPLEYATRNATWFPTQLTGQHYLALLESRAYRYLANTVIVSLSATALALAIGLMAAYALARFRFPAKLDALFLLWVLLVRMAPPVVMAIPLYTTLRSLGLLNSLFGLVIVYQIYILPYAIWMMLGFVREVPIEVEEAASIDGASKWRTLISVVLPLVGPGLVATAIFSVIMTWNEFIYAIIFTSSKDVFPMTVGIFYFVGDEVIEWNSLSAVAIFTSLPAIVFFIFFQKYIIEGLVKGAVKM